MPFDDLDRGLGAAMLAGNVRPVGGPSGLHLYCYTQKCVYDKAWDEFTTMARGLILHHETKTVVATPFPKFFNASEVQDPFPPGVPFEVFDKLDGSLFIVYHHAGRWRCATKGSFDSEQARWAEQWITNKDRSSLVAGFTYLVEAIYPENRVVVPYGHESTGLHLLAIYDDLGHEMSRLTLEFVAGLLGWPVVPRCFFDSPADLLAAAASLPATEEGFVVRFADGRRVKVKGDEYLRLHRLISRVTPLAVWEAMRAGDDLEAMRRQLPEEFWDDFGQIVYLLDERYIGLVHRVDNAVRPFEGLPDRDMGQRLHEIPEDVRPFARSCSRTARPATGSMPASARACSAPSAPPTTSCPATPRRPRWPESPPRSVDPNQEPRHDARTYRRSRRDHFQAQVLHEASALPIVRRLRPTSQLAWRVRRDPPPLRGDGVFRPCDPRLGHPR